MREKQFLSFCILADCHIVGSWECANNLFIWEMFINFLTRIFVTHKLLGNGIFGGDLENSGIFRIEVLEPSQAYMQYKQYIQMSQY